jgi:hypothetical protein
MPIFINITSYTKVSRHITHERHIITFDIKYISACLYLKRINKTKHKIKQVVNYRRRERVGMERQRKMLDFLSVYWNHGNILRTIM